MEAKILSREKKKKKKNHCLHTAGNVSEAGSKTNGAIVSSSEHWVSGPALSITVTRIVIATATSYVVWRWQVVAQQNSMAFFL